MTSRSTRSNASADARSRPLSPSRARFDRVAFARQPIGQRHDEPRLVFDEQHPLHEGRTGLGRPAASAEASAADWSRSAGAPSATGRCTVNALPSPGALLTVTRPPCASDDPLHEAQAETGALICAATTSAAR